MKPISVHVDEHDYQEFKSLSARDGRPVSQLIREAMTLYLDQRSSSQASVLDIEPLECGKLLKGWTRSEIYDEMTQS